MGWEIFAQLCAFAALFARVEHRFTRLEMAMEQCDFCKASKTRNLSPGQFYQASGQPYSKESQQ